MRLFILLLLFVSLFHYKAQSQASGLSGKRLIINYLPEAGIFADQKLFYIEPVHFEIGYVVESRIALNLGLSTFKSGKFSVYRDYGDVDVKTRYFLADIGVKVFKNLAPLRGYMKHSFIFGYNTFEYEYNPIIFFPQKDLNGFTIGTKFATGSQRPINKTLFAGYEWFVSPGVTFSNNHVLAFFKLGVALNIGAVL